MKHVACTCVTVLLAGLVGAGTARGEDISGVISSTKFITEDSRLVGNVTCTTTTEPCIDLAANFITLRLNGFTITGPADPEGAMCNATSGLPMADGIRINNFTHVNILGPGMVQRFRRHGILVVGSGSSGSLETRSRIRIRGVTSHHNCFSGLLTNGMTYSVIEEIVSVRNGINSTGAPCGGSCLVNSYNNVIRRNIFGGNGSIANNNNDFGVGLINLSSGNLIEENTITGNTNGVLIQAGAQSNTIRLNVMAGNPPVQVTKDHGVFIGADIKDEAGSNGERNTFDRNWCLTYLGPGPSPCATFP